MSIRGILFDIGDTLLGATKLQHGVLEETVRDFPKENWTITPEAFLQTYQIADRDPLFDLAPDLNHLYADQRIVERVFVSLSWQFAEKFLEIYRTKLRANLRRDPALIELLTALRHRGICLGIVSNGTTREQCEQLELLGIREFFDPILISQQEGIRKPDPEIFLLAKSRWGFAPREILVVGDRGDWEVLGAKKAGMQSALTTQFVDHRAQLLPNAQPDYIIGNLDELLQIVEKAR